jgi:hypothetical protein
MGAHFLSTRIAPVLAGLFPDQHLHQDRQRAARRWLAVIPVALVLFPKPQLWAEDPILGTWKLNVRKSTFHPGPGFRGETRTYERQAD